MLAHRAVRPSTDAATDQQRVIAIQHLRIEHGRIEYIENVELARLQA